MIRRHGLLVVAALAVALTAALTFALLPRGEPPVAPPQTRDAAPPGTADRTGAAAPAGADAAAPRQRERSWTLEMTSPDAAHGSAPGAPSDGGAGAGAAPAPATAAGAAAASTGTASLLVAVRDGEARSVPDARVSLWTSARTARVEGVTDARGQVSFAGLPQGAWSWRVAAPERPVVVSVRPVTLVHGEARSLGIELDTYALAISGRVLARRGEPVAGRGGPPPPHDGAYRLEREPADVTAEDGRYTLRELAPGDYEVHTLATDRHPATRAIFRAGFDSADLVVDETRAAVVHGTVTGEYDQPLADVRVVPTPPTPETRTDATGTYQVWLVQSERQPVHVIRFEAEGHQEQRLRVLARDLLGKDELRRDVQLEARGETTPVAGRVVDGDGEPVSGQSVRLQSRSLDAHYRVSSDARGAFRFPEVRVARDYRLFVVPAGGYRDWAREPLAVERDGPELEIVLERLHTGRLRGRMEDAEGTPLPGAQLWLRSDRARGVSLSVTADARGEFQLEGVPAGNLTLATRSAPHLRVRGIRLEEGEEADVVVVLDQGGRGVEGHVLGERGRPVSGARVRLVWSDERQGLASSSNRSTLSDADGAFRFTGLGPGRHQLEVDATGYEPARQVLDAARDGRALELRLRSEAQ